MKRFFLSFRFAFEGMVCAFNRERNLKIHLSVALLVTIIGFIIRLSFVEWMILVLTIGGVIVTELLNTAIERIVDLASEEFHPLAKQAKDIAAAACLISAVVSVIIGILLFVPKIIQF